MNELHLPVGFRFAGVHCGIKKNLQKEDLTLIHCPKGATAAGVYTTNLIFAAPVAVDRARTPSGIMYGVVANSGNANACTGERGLKDAQEMTRLAATAIGAVEENEVLVMSTGVIGVFLPMDKIAAGIEAAGRRLSSDEDSFLAAARGILTTDKGVKVASRLLRLGDREIRLAGMCKGAGMIGPHMATMLAVITTDAPLGPEEAQPLLKAAVDESFNCISVEGHMSTNDTVLLLASGMAGLSDPSDLADYRPLWDEELSQFQKALTDLCIELARQIPDDGEGASHLINVEIRGAKDRQSARQIAQTVANSALVKTAIAGGDPNWGRIVSAVGYAGVPIDAAAVGLQINGHTLYERGSPVSFDAKTVSQSIRENRETQLVLTVGSGPAAIRFWTSDLNVNYVRFNADYTT